MVKRIMRFEYILPKILLCVIILNSEAFASSPEEYDFWVSLAFPTELDSFSKPYPHNWKWSYSFLLSGDVIFNNKAYLGLSAGITKRNADSKIFDDMHEESVHIDGVLGKQIQISGLNLHAGIDIGIMSSRISWGNGSYLSGCGGSFGFCFGSLDYREYGDDTTLVALLGPLVGFHYKHFRVEYRVIGKRVLTYSRKYKYDDLFTETKEGFDKNSIVQMLVFSFGGVTQLRDSK